MIEAVQEWLRAWLTSVVLVSVLLSAAQSLIPPGTVRKAAGFTGGLILLLVLLRPVLGADLEHLELDFDHYQAAVEERQEELAHTDRGHGFYHSGADRSIYIGQSGRAGAGGDRPGGDADGGKRHPGALVRGADGQLVAGAGVGAGDGTGHPGGEAGLA